MSTPSRVLTASRTLTAVKGKALYHDGIDDYVSIPDDPSLDITDAITIEAWANVERFEQYNEIIGKGYVFTVQSFGYSCGGRQLRIYFYDLSDPGFFYSDCVPVSTWFHFAVTYDSSTGNVFWYINGVGKLAGNTSGNLATSTYPLRIGFKFAGTNCFNGTIALVRIYKDYALTPEEVLYNKEHPYNPVLHGCVLWLGYDSIDEGAGIWRDKSGQNNDGVIYGATAVEMNKLAGRVLSV